MGSAQGPVTSELEQARSAPEFGAHTPLAEKLLAVAIRAQNFTGSSGVAIALTEGQEMVCRANWGTSAPEVGAKLSTDNSFTGLCVRTGEPLRCDDAQTDPRVDPEACRALGISAIAVAPVRRGLKVIGVIAAFSDTPHAFTDKHLLILTTLSEVIVELLDDPHPVRPLPQALEAGPDLTRATAVAQAPAAPRVEKSAVKSVVQEPATPPVQEVPVVAPALPVPPEKAPGRPTVRHSASDQLAGGRPEGSRKKEDEIWPSALDPGPLPQPPKTAFPPPRSQTGLGGDHAPPPQPTKTGPPAGDAASARLKLVKPPASTPAPDFGPELTFSGFEADASPGRRWLLLAAVLAIFAILAAAGWRLQVARNASLAKHAPAAAAPAPEATHPQPERVQPPEPAPVAAEHVLVSSPPKVSVGPSPAKAAPASEQLTEVGDVTVRRGPQPVVEDAGPVRRPATGASRSAQAPEAPQLALSTPDLPTALAKPTPAAVTRPVSRVIPAQLNHRVEPPYPDAARRLGISGKVVMKATITKAGTVGSVRWVSGNDMFRDTTVAAVKQWRYKPASLNGQSVDSDLEIVLQFKGAANQ
jgi:TonB family protein